MKLRNLLMATAILFSCNAFAQQTLGPSSVSQGTFVFTQDNVADTWVIVHNLNKYPSATVVDSGLNVNIGDITYDSKNQITIRFSAPFSGKAFLN